jgi:hypothetical protein
MNSKEHITSTIQLEAHPPERKSSSVVVGGVCCSTCCCCCCCLHSAAGIVGSVVASGLVLSTKPKIQPFRLKPPPQAMSPYQRQAYPIQQNNQIHYETLVADYKSSARTAVGLYWGLLVGTVIFSSFLGEIGLIGLAILFPIAQIFIGVITIILVNILPLRDRNAATKAIAKLLAGSFIGIVVGTILIFLYAVLK